jgi:hypothetical protein
MLDNDDDDDEESEFLKMEKYFLAFSLLKADEISKFIFTNLFNIC